MAAILLKICIFLLLQKATYLLQEKSFEKLEIPKDEKGNRFFSYLKARELNSDPKKSGLFISVLIGSILAIIIGIGLIVSIVIDVTNLIF